jgi:hypothetical protein
MVGTISQIAHNNNTLLIVEIKPTYSAFSSVYISTQHDPVFGSNVSWKLLLTQMLPLLLRLLFIAIMSSLYCCMPIVEPPLPKLVTAML